MVGSQLIAAIDVMYVLQRFIKMNFLPNHDLRTASKLKLQMFLKANGVYGSEVSGRIGYAGSRILSVLACRGSIQRWPVGNYIKGFLIYCFIALPPTKQYCP
jgi:hypothetical protein